MPVVSSLRRFLAVVWAGPNTVVGLMIGFLAMAFGTRMRVHDGCLEFYGGIVARILRRMPTGNGAAAMTLGHVIFGIDLHALTVTAEHERVHVRQYEYWGPMFVPAYLACSTYLWLRGRNAYMDNPFEVAAYREADFRTLSDGVPKSD